MLDYLNVHGNNYYNSQKKGKDKTHLKYILKKDILNVSKYFDVLIFWRENINKYKMIGAASSIVLGKPTHTLSKNVYLVGVHILILD